MNRTTSMRMRRKRSKIIQPTGKVFLRSRETLSILAMSMRKMRTTMMVRKMRGRRASTKDTTNSKKILTLKRRIQTSRCTVMVSNPVTMLQLSMLTTKTAVAAIRTCKRNHTA